MHLQAVMKLACTTVISCVDIFVMHNFLSAEVCKELLQLHQSTIQSRIDTGTAKSVPWCFTSFAQLDRLVRRIPPVLNLTAAELTSLQPNDDGAWCAMPLEETGDANNVLEELHHVSASTLFTRGDPRSNAIMEDIRMNIS
eukprot:m.1198183 g.1198183  ORF g.1198183 m.1198183 type:complete len:141 (+) comp24569_c0_seq26:460-882(+)